MIKLLKLNKNEDAPVTMQFLVSDTMRPQMSAEHKYSFSARPVYKHYLMLPLPFQGT